MHFTQATAIQCPPLIIFRTVSQNPSAQGVHCCDFMINKVYFYIVVFTLLSTNYALSQATESPPRIAILGDSGATGAVTDPTFDLSAGNFFSQLADLVFNQKSIFQPALEHYSSPKEFHLTDPLDPPRRIFFSEQEEQQEDDRLMDLQTRAIRRVDIGQFSWGYSLLYWQNFY